MSRATSNVNKEKKAVGGVNAALGIASPEAAPQIDWRHVKKNEIEKMASSTVNWNVGTVGYRQFPKRKKPYRPGPVARGQPTRRGSNPGK